MKTPRYTRDDQQKVTAVEFDRVRLKADSKIFKTGEIAAVIGLADEHVTTEKGILVDEQGQVADKITREPMRVLICDGNAKSMIDGSWSNSEWVAADLLEIV
jgi:hypothetical protein